MTATETPNPVAPESEPASASPMTAAEFTSDPLAPPAAPRPAPRRFLRSRTDRKIAGVCGGVAELLDVDVTIVRIGFIGAAFVSGLGIWVYLAAWLVAPQAEA